MTKIILKTSRFTKNPNTKTSYILTEEETQEVTEQQHKNATSPDTMKFFKRLGGSESRVMSYTCNGYKCIKATSISPDRQSKTIREYQFIYSDK
jgi:hypothetical protein